MIKYYCDCCGKESDGVNKVEIPCHQWSRYSQGGGYQDSDGNQISGRKDVIHACNRCYNLIYGDMRTSILEIQSLNYKTITDNKKPILKEG